MSIASSTIIMHSQFYINSILRHTVYYNITLTNPEGRKSSLFGVLLVLLASYSLFLRRERRSVACLLVMEVSNGAPSGGGADVVPAAPPVSVDLARLANIVGCSVQELVKGVHKGTKRRVSAVVLPVAATTTDAGESTYGSLREPGDGSDHQNSSSEYNDGKGITTFIIKNAVKISEAPLYTQKAVISAVSSGDGLVSGVPKPLLMLGGSEVDEGMSVIEINLYNLFRAGIVSVVLLVGRHGRAIRDHVMQSPIYDRLDVAFVELGEDYSGFFAETLMRAAPLIQPQERFLLCSADHCFEPDIIQSMANLPAGPLAGSYQFVLVERDFTAEQQQALPHSAVFATLQEDRVDRIWSGLPLGPALEAGLFNFDDSLFEVLRHFQRTSVRGGGTYFTLSQAMAVFAERGQMKFEAVNGRTWLAIETRLQAVEAENLSSDEPCFPWEAHCFEHSLQARKDTVILGVPVHQGTDVSLMQGGKEFQGLLMPVESAPPIGPAPDGEEQENLLNPRNRRTTIDWSELYPKATSDAAPLSAFSSTPGCVGGVLGLQIESTYFDPEAQIGLLIPAGATLTAGRQLRAADDSLAKEAYMLAIPTGAGEGEAHGGSFLPALPSDISGVIVQTETRGMSVDIKLKVTRQVPVFGWVMLTLGLVSQAAAGAFTGLFVQIVPDINLVTTAAWRFQGTLFISAFAYFMALGEERFRNQITNRDMALQNCLQGISLGVWGITIYKTFQYMSVGLAVLFAGQAPLLLVLWKAVRREPVLAMEALGVVVAISGSVICSFEKSDDAASTDYNFALGVVYGLATSVASVFYYTASKAMRDDVDPLNWLFPGRLLAFLVVTIYLGALFPSTVLDPELGIFGWVRTSELIGLQLLASFVTEILGLLLLYLCFKYVDALLMTTVLLFTPVVAVAETLMIGMGSMPGAPVMIGGAVIIAGAGLVVRAGSKPRVEVYDAPGLRVSGTHAALTHPSCV
jgi:drug/metabolite transporter (DMT)-like permease/NDP-sugar pyrophosphorylase family protein